MTSKWFFSACGAFLLAFVLPWTVVAEEHVESDALKSLEIGGVLQQGGFVRGRLPKGTQLLSDESAILVSSTGHFFIGLDRDAPKDLTLVFQTGGNTQPLTLSIAPRTYREGQVIQGLSRGIGAPSSEPLGHDDLFPDDDSINADATLSRSIKPGASSLTRAQEAQNKAEALSSRADIDGFMEDWISPFEDVYPISSPWGAARIVRGNKRIHYGVDIAAPLGTGIRAPASGIVTLAATDYYYEGGVVFIDHGLGLTSIYLHMSDVGVAEGDIVEQGELLGKVGAEGRASGPHLCWRLYWNGRQVKIDPQEF